jgi:hypothetical protein
MFTAACASGPEGHGGFEARRPGMKTARKRHLFGVWSRMAVRPGFMTRLRMELRSCTRL